MKKTKIVMMAAVISVMLSIGSSNAMAQLKGYGSILPSNEVTQTFERHQINPDLDYYFSGPEESPDVIIGVNKTYSLDSTLWTKIAVTPEALQEAISSMQSLASEEEVALHGFTILDDKGIPIGVWYSPLDNATYVKIENEKTFFIQTPSATGRLSTLKDSAG
jgi:hypothetical protein